MSKILLPNEPKVDIAIDDFRLKSNLTTQKQLDLLKHIFPVKFWALPNHTWEY